MKTVPKQDPASEQRIVRTKFPKAWCRRTSTRDDDGNILYQIKETMLRSSRTLGWGKSAYTAWCSAARYITYTTRNEVPVSSRRPQP